MTLGHLALWASAWAVLGAAHALAERYRKTPHTTPPKEPQDE